MDVALWNEYWMGLSMARWGEVQSEKNRKKQMSQGFRSKKHRIVRKQTCSDKIVPQSEKFQTLKHD